MMIYLILSLLAIFLFLVALCGGLYLWDIIVFGRYFKSLPWDPDAKKRVEAKLADLDRKKRVCQRWFEESGYRIDSMAGESVREAIQEIKSAKCLARSWGFK
jgi:hypothetical protein